MTLDIAQPILWEDVETAIVDWVNEITGLVVHWADQAEPQPDRPFALLSITGPIALGLSDEKRIEETSPGSDEYQERSIGQKEITIEIQIEVDEESSQDPRAHARALATRLQSSLTINSVTDKLEDVGLAYREAGPITDVSIPIADKFVNRSVFEYRAGLASTIIETGDGITIIEKAQGTGTVSEKVAGGDFTVPIDVDAS